MNQNLLIVSPHSFIHAYGGVLYLADALWEKGVKVRVLGLLQREYAHLLPARPYPVIDLARTPFSQIPKLRRLIWSSRIMIEGLRSPTHFLFNDYTFYREAVILKRMRPRARLLHYTTECLTPEEHPGYPGIRFYERHAATADLTIDVERHRAEYREKRFGLSALPLVLPNTLPRDAIPANGPPGCLSQLAGVALPKNRFILLFAGTAHPNMSFDRLLEALRLCSTPVFFLGFIRGEAFRVAAWRKQLLEKLGTEGGVLCNAVPRSELLQAMHEADAGLIYYPPHDEPSVNQMYCAPTKLYEYLAADLPVVGSANPSLRDLLEPAQMGFCAKEDTPAALANAIDNVISKFGRNAGMTHSYIANIFRANLCFEKSSEPVVSAILQMMNSNDGQGENTQNL